MWQARRYVLVAPVTLGAGATVGGGSTITKDVPAGAWLWRAASSVAIADLARYQAAQAMSAIAVGPVDLPGARAGADRFDALDVPALRTLLAQRDPATGGARRRPAGLDARRLARPARTAAPSPPSARWCAGCCGRRLAWTQPPACGGAGISGHHGPVCSPHGAHARRPAATGAHCAHRSREPWTWGRWCTSAQALAPRCARPHGAVAGRWPLAYRAGRPCSPCCQLLAELIGNALKFAAHGPAQIRVTAECSAGRALHPVRTGQRRGI